MITRIVSFAGVVAGLVVVLTGCMTPRPADLSITQRDPYVAPTGASQGPGDAARVVELRGKDGKLAKISLGTREGAAAGLTVEFFVFADYSDLVPGASSEPSAIGYGRITETDEEFAWVKVTSPERGVVCRGHYARIAPEQPKNPIEKVKGMFKKDR